jgi:phosphoglycolate phosphatase
MNNDSIIFDIDGTLWNACPSSTKGINNAFKKLGIDREFLVQEIESITGHPFKHGIELLFPDKEIDQFTMDTLNSCEMEIIKKEGGVFYDGIIEGIIDLASSYKIFLVSNCQDWYLDVFLNFSGLRPILTGFDCYGLSGLSKAEMLLKIKNNYILNNPVYIGDTEGDEIATNLAKMEFIYVSYGFGKAKNNPKTFNSSTSLMDYLKKGKKL